MTDATTLPPEDDNENENVGNLGNETPETPAVPAAKPKAAPKPAKAPAAPKAAPKSADKPVEVILAAKRVKIILEENDNIPPTGLFVGVNGRSFLIRAGEEVEVPVEVVEVLNDAVEDVPRTDGNNNVLDYRKKMRFPYRLIGK